MANYIVKLQYDSTDFYGNKVRVIDVIEDSITDNYHICRIRHFHVKTKVYEKKADATKAAKQYFETLSKENKVYDVIEIDTTKNATTL